MRQLNVRCHVVLTAALFLVGCGGVIPHTPEYPPAPQRPAYEPPAARPTPATPMAAQPTISALKGPNARNSGVVAGTDINSLPLTNENAVRALAAFRTSCPALLRRGDASGLTQSSDWQTVCTVAAATSDADARSFFLSNFETVQVGSGAAFSTGYFIPEIKASRTPSADYATPIYKRPADEIDVDLGAFSDAYKGKQIHGHVVAVPIVSGTQDRFLPFPERADIVNGAFNGKGLELAYAADPVAFFFLQVQGSGILRFPDGTTTRIGFAGQNGHDYTGIGATMRTRNLFADGAYSYQNIVNYLHAHPDEAAQIMNENKSFVFFRELPDTGIPGAMGAALTDRISLAADPAFVPLGAPVFLSMDRTEANGLWIAQDTGGAIKGANRFDTYWGAGAAAQAIAGGMSSHGTAFVLVPVGTLSRLQAASNAVPNAAPNAATPPARH